jgi:xanthine dehydrogenase iron-sulfur cluster and FAD-binding subunit A
LYTNGSLSRDFADARQREHQHDAPDRERQESRRRRRAGHALLYVLRNDLELNGPKYGAGSAKCGACTVLIDGVAARSCVHPDRRLHRAATS